MQASMAMPYMAACAEASHFQTAMAMCKHQLAAKPPEETTMRRQPRQFLRRRLGSCSHLSMVKSSMDEVSRLECEQYRHLHLAFLSLSRWL